MSVLNNRTAESKARIDNYARKFTKRMQSCCNILDINNGVKERWLNYRWERKLICHNVQ